MRKRVYWVLPGILTIALLATGYWGYSEYQARQNLQNRAESLYQKSFHELSWHIDTITGQLAQALISSSKEQAVLTLATIWRQVFAAQEDLGALPLAFVPLSKTEKFLSDAGDVSYALLNRAAQGQEGLSEKELKTVEQLYNRAKVLREELAKVGSQVLDRELSWTQVEVSAVQANGELADNTIIDGFQLMEKKMEEYPELNLDEEFGRVRPDVKKVRGNQDISAAEAQNIAHRWWFPPDDRHQGRISYEGVGDIPTFGIEFPPMENENVPVYVDVSKLDGTIIWAMKPKTIGDLSLDLKSGERNAQSFLQRHGFNDMMLVEVDQGDGTGIYTFVPRQGDVLLYPDQVKVQVALDNGEIIGYEGTPYYMYHKTRQLGSPRISEAQLRQQISPYLNVELIRPALIADTWGKEILAWEVRGSIDTEKFVIFYNALTGSEESIVRITPPPKFDFNVEG